jgi:hypothetical protein
VCHGDFDLNTADSACTQGDLIALTGIYMAIKKKSLIGPDATKNREAEGTSNKASANRAGPAKPRKLAVAKLATAKLSTAKLTTLRRLT